MTEIEAATTDVIDSDVLAEGMLGVKPEWRSFKGFFMRTQVNISAGIFILEV
jgi:hypothetical protein